MKIQIITCKVFLQVQMYMLFIFLNCQAAVSQGIDCIVAPYEADAQLAYLSLSGIAQLIISEDSDLLCFGCERVSQR